MDAMWMPMPTACIAADRGQRMALSDNVATRTAPPPRVQWRVRLPVLHACMSCACMSVRPAAMTHGGKATGRCIRHEQVEWISCAQAGGDMPAAGSGTPTHTNPLRPLSPCQPPTMESSCGCRGSAWPTSCACRHARGRRAPAAAHAAAPPTTTSGPSDWSTLVARG